MSDKNIGAQLSEELCFKLFVDSVRDYAILMLDTEGRVVSWNPGAERIKGYKAEEIIGKHFSCFYASDEVKKGKPQADLRIAAAEGRFREDGWRVRKDGTRFLANVTITAVRDSNGKLLGFGKVTQDVTVKNKADLLFRDLLEAAPDAVVILDHSGKIAIVNAQTERLFGYRRSELLDEAVEKLIPKRPQDQNFDQLQFHHQSSSKFQKKAISAELELYGTRKDGTEFPIEISLNPLGTGTEMLVLIAIRDISARRSLEAENRRLQDERELFFTLSLDMLCISGMDGYFKYMNPAWENALGFSPAELLSKPIVDFVHPDDVAPTMREIEKQTKGESVLSFENRYLCKDGSYKWLSWKSVPVGEFMYAAARDVTESKKVEIQVQEASRLKSEFLANMSHELRTPLNAIIGFASLMHKEKLGTIAPNQKEYLGDILTSSQHLLQLINDILDLAKIEAGKFQFTSEDIDLEMLVREVRDILRGLTGGKNLHIEFTIGPDLKVVTLDPAKLKQVLYNYLSNAIKFTAEGGHVTVRMFAVPENKFQIDVEDTGIGIKPEDIKRLFGEFQQLDASTSKKYPGTGLGLALTKRLVEAQGGSVSVRSEWGKGATFSAVLPRSTSQFNPQSKQVGTK